MKNIVLLIVLILSSTFLYAQPSFDEDVTDVPVDGGIITITLMAAAYGAKRYKENREKSE